MFTVRNRARNKQSLGNIKLKKTRSYEKEKSKRQQ